MISWVDWLHKHSTLSLATSIKFVKGRLNWSNSVFICWFKTVSTDSSSIQYFLFDPWCCWRNSIHSSIKAAKLCESGTLNDNVFSYKKLFHSTIFQMTAPESLTTSGSSTKTTLSLDICYGCCPQTVVNGFISQNLHINYFGKYEYVCWRGEGLLHHSSTFGIDSRT